MSIPNADELSEEETIDEEERREKIRDKYKYVCIAFDGDHPQIAATEQTLIPRSISKNQNLVFLKWAGGCSMTQSPNDNNRGMHPVLKKVYGDSKYRYGVIADPPGEKWVLLKAYLREFLDPSSFRTVWKAMCYAPSTLQNACKASSKRSAYHNTGIIDQDKLLEMQNGVDTNPSNPRTILGVNSFFNHFTVDDGNYMLSKIDEFAEITSRRGYIPEDDFTKVLMGKTYLDNCPALKPGSKPLNDMVTNRQRNLVMSNEGFIDQCRSRKENRNMAEADKETRDINIKVFRPAYKAEAMEKKKTEANEAKRLKEVTKKMKDDMRMETKRKRGEEKASKKVNQKRGDKSSV